MWEDNIVKFGLKKRSISDVHNIWVKSCVRSNLRRNKILEIQEKIISEIPDVDGDGSSRKLVYFINNDIVYKISFSKSDYLGVWTYNTSPLNFSGDKKIGRDQKIEFILSNERQFELGEEFINAKNLRSSLQHEIQYRITEMVTEKLKVFYKDKGIESYEIPKVSIVEINDIKYYYLLEENNGFSYIKFKYGGEVKDVIKI